MKRFRILLLAVVIILTGCHQNGTVGDTKLYEPYCIANAGIPLADNLYTSQFDRVTEVETDNYGRRYFIYTTYSIMYNAKVELHIICQATRDDQIYYYPDYCYWIYKVEDSPYSDEHIACLKEWNDWNSPLDEDRMYTTSYAQSHKNIAYEQDIKSAVCAYFSVDDSNGVISNGLEWINANEQLFVVSIFERGNTSKSTDFYIILYNSRQSNPIVMYEKIEDPLSCQAQIQAFREACLNENRMFP